MLIEKAGHVLLFLIAWMSQWLLEGGNYSLCEIVSRISSTFIQSWYLCSCLSALLLYVRSLRILNSFDFW